MLKTKAAGIPVILIDRDVDHSIAKPGEDYVTFIGSDFVDQGRRAAEWLAKATGGKAKIIELEGTTGADPAIDRKKGFDDYLAGTFKGTPDGRWRVRRDGDHRLPNGNFTRDNGRQVMQTLLQAHPDVTAVYAHNDEMAIGAIAALEDAGRKPGEDVIVVSIDGENAAMDAIVDGTLGASVESSPFFGPIAFETMKKFVDGEEIADWVKVEDRFFDRSNAAEIPGQAVLDNVRHGDQESTSPGDRRRTGLWTLGLWTPDSSGLRGPSLRSWAASCLNNPQRNRARLTLLLEMRDIVKVFPGVVALDDARLTVMTGEVHAIVGQNGAGKSTLIKILNGAYRKDGGTIVFDGRRGRFRHPTRGAGRRRQHDLPGDQSRSLPHGGREHLHGSRAAPLRADRLATHEPRSHARSWRASASSSMSSNHCSSSMSPCSRWSPSRGRSPSDRSSSSWTSRPRRSTNARWRSSSK